MIALTTVSIAISFAFMQMIENNFALLNTENYFLLDDGVNLNDIEMDLRELGIDNYELMDFPYTYVQGSEEIEVNGHTQKLKLNYGVRFLMDGELPENVKRYLYYTNGGDNKLLYAGRTPVEEYEIALPFTVAYELKQFTDGEIKNLIGTKVKFHSSDSSGYLYENEFTVCGITHDDGNCAYYMFLNNFIVGTNSSTIENNFEFSTFPEYRLLYLSRFYDTEKQMSIVEAIEGRYYGDGVYGEYSFNQSIKNFANTAFLSVDLPFVAAFMCLLVLICVKFLNNQEKIVALKLSLGVTYNKITLEYCIRFLICSFVAMALAIGISYLLSSALTIIFESVSIYMTIDMTIIGITILCAFSEMLLIFAIMLSLCLYKLKTLSIMRLLRN